MAGRKKTVKKKKASTSQKQTTSKKGHVTRGMAVASLVLNLLLIPGLGTILGGRTKEGVWQVVFLCFGLLLSLVYIGIPLVIAAWIWSLISSIGIMNSAQ